MSYPDEDHREYPVTDRQFERAEWLISMIGQKKRAIADHMQAFLDGMGIKVTPKDWRHYVECQHEIIDDLLHSEIKDAQEAIDNYPDTYVADNRLLTSQLV